MDSEDHAAHMRYHRCRLALAPLGVLLPVHPEKLGSGSYAVTYATECGRVVKITEDPSDARAALLVKDNPQPRLVRVDHVFKVPGRYPTWALVVERLNPLPLGLQAGWHVGNLNEAFLADPWKYATANGIPDVVLEHCVQITHCLQAIGITDCFDAHRYNVMVRPSTGEVVLSDLGCSRSPVAADAPLLPGELLVEELLAQLPLVEESRREFTEPLRSMPFSQRRTVDWCEPLPF